MVDVAFVHGRRQENSPQLLGVERQGVRAGTDEGGDDDINGDVARTHGKGDDTDFRHQITPTIGDQSPRLRLKQLNIKVYQGAVVDRHDEVETLLEHDAVAIHTQRIKEVPRDSDTLVHQQIAKELGGEPCVVRFL